MSHTKVVKSPVREDYAFRLPAEMNETELNSLFAECLPRLSHAARKFLRNPQDSEDAVQEALLLAYKKLHQFEGRASFSTWLHTILRNTASGYYRKASARRMCSADPEFFGEEGEPLDKEFLDTKPNPEEGYVQRERSEILQSAARTLPPKYEDVVQEFYSKGLCEAQAAKNLGITVAALKARLHRARILVARRIRQRGLMQPKRGVPRGRIVGIGDRRGVSFFNRHGAVRKLQASGCPGFLDG